MKVYEIMTRNAECIGPDATLNDAAEKMKKLGIGFLPVCEEDRLIGALTDRDITVRSVAEGHDPRCDAVRAVMSPQVIYCFESTDVADAAKLMRQRQVRRLPVLNHFKRLVGILSLGDLAVECGAEDLAEQALEGISEPSSPTR
jgi:CBS domain-containing protein